MTTQGNGKLTHLLNRAKESFKSKLYAMSGADSASPVAPSSSTSSIPTLKVVISIQRPDDLRLDLDTAESYNLSVKTSGVQFNRGWRVTFISINSKDILGSSLKSITYHALSIDTYLNL